MTRPVTSFALILAALLAGGPAIAQGALEAPAEQQAPEALAPDLELIAVDRDPLAPASPVVTQKVQECAGEKFVFAWGAGARPTKVTLCSDKGATTEEIVRMLEDAAAKIDSSPLPEDRRTAIALQIRGKIAELKGKGAASVPGQAGDSMAVPATVAPPVQAAPTTEAVAAIRPPAPVSAPVAALPKPRLEFHCYSPNQIGSGGPCVILDRDTRLTVKAVEALGAGTSLRFARSGRERAEVALGQMRKGQSRILGLPAKLCSGVVQAEAEIQITRGGRVLDKIGPYLLRC
ncbi:MAG TPA: hypothetical protein VMK31_03420 [Sphingomicrobium sp.]|nr:hypothetical protein [Sphingomicrobium sp.]